MSHGLLAMCLFGLVRGETLHKKHNKKTTGSNTSYIQTLLGNKDKKMQGEVQDDDIYEHTDIIDKRGKPNFFPLAN